jgi:hypothetical protein
LSGDFKLPPIRRPGKDAEQDASRPAPLDRKPTTDRPRRSANGRGTREPKEANRENSTRNRAEPYSGRRPANERERIPPDTEQRPTGERERIPPDTEQRPTGERERTAEETGRRPAGEPERTPEETGRRPSNDRRRQPESGHRPGQETERNAVDRIGANPRTVGPWITLTGRLVREPQSLERPKPSAAPVLVALVLLALCLLLPYVLVSLGYVVIGLVLLILVSRKLHLGWGLRGMGSRRDGQEKPRILVTNFRVGVPRPDDPRAVGPMFSCRLLTKQMDGAVELSSGDEVTISGWRSGGGLVHVHSLTVNSTRSRIKAASGASTAPVAVTTLVLLALSAGALWVNRAWMTPDVLAQALNVVQQSVVSLITLVVIVLIMWFVVKKVILRR